ncbi:MAG TPA: DHH family phosphoesterase [Methanomicrobia archaeon]|nr:DHH family phosphoesterase [Methanomicrobia archaeon]HEX59638.1 DHH family phosphoesterase [Methanomicrobia archaeon]
MMERLRKAVEEAAGIIKEHEFARIVSHYDADGITAAGILCNALYRLNIRFHVTLVGKLDSTILRNLSDEKLVIFCDMGSGQLGNLSGLKGTVVILDHHVCYDERRNGVLHVNPYLFGINGMDTVSSAGIAYLLAKCMDERNVELAGLAIAGALGDKQVMAGINKEILEEAVKAGVVSVRRGLRMGAGVIKDMLLFCTDPYLELAGEPELVEAFLEEVKINGTKRLDELSEEELERLTEGLLSRAPAASREALIGDVYTLNFEVIKDGMSFARTLDAVGRFGRTGIAVALCMGDESALDEALYLHRKFQSRLVAELKRVKDDIISGENIRYFYVREKNITGVLAGIIARYIFTDKPVATVNKSRGKETKISVRCSRMLISQGIDLAKAVEAAAEAVGGRGGGHPVASGAAVPEGAEVEFLKILDKIIGEQKKGNA